MEVPAATNHPALVCNYQKKVGTLQSMMVMEKSK